MITQHSFIPHLPHCKATIANVSHSQATMPCSWDYAVTVICKAEVQEWYLEHGPDMLQVGGAKKMGLSMAHCLHQSFSCLSHLLHLHIIQQPPLLLIGYTCHQNRASFRKCPKNTALYTQKSIILLRVLKNYVYKLISKAENSLRDLITSTVLTLLAGLGRNWILFALLHGNFFPCNLIINRREILLRQVFTVINATVHLNVLFLCHFVLHLRRNIHYDYHTRTNNRNLAFRRRDSVKGHDCEVQDDQGNQDEAKRELNGDLKQKGFVSCARVLTQTDWPEGCADQWLT